MMTDSRWHTGHRLTLASITLACVLISAAETSSQMFAVTERSGVLGTVVLVMLMVLALGALVDVTLNDFVDVPYAPFLKRHRCEAYCGTAALNLAFIYALLKGGDWTWLVSLYAVIAAGAVWVAVEDVWRHNVVPRKRANRHKVHPC
jgi:hypothetical protein